MRPISVIEIRLLLQFFNYNVKEGKHFFAPHSIIFFNYTRNHGNGFFMPKIMQGQKMYKTFKARVINRSSRIFHCKPRVEVWKILKKKWLEDDHIARFLTFSTGVHIYGKSTFCTCLLFLRNTKNTLHISW